MGSEVHSAEEREADVRSGLAQDRERDFEVGGADWMRRVLEAMCRRQLAIQLTSESRVESEQPCGHHALREEMAEDAG